MRLWATSTSRGPSQPGLAQASWRPTGLRPDGGNLALNNPAGFDEIPPSRAVRVSLFTSAFWTLDLVTSAFENLDLVTSAFETLDHDGALTLNPKPRSHSKDPHPSTTEHGGAGHSHVPFLGDVKTTLGPGDAFGEDALIHSVKTRCVSGEA